MKYRKIPGKEIKKIGTLVNRERPTITIITPFYNGEKTLMQTANSIFSQTYPYFEWIIIDDGSTSKDSKKALDDLSKLDKRVKVLHKENGGPSQARDYGIKHSSSDSKYIYFIDCDDLIESNMLEMMYFALETHPNASFVYPSIVNFGAHKYYWEPYFTLEEELVNNILCINTMIRKSDLLEVGCFGIKEKAMYEDWNLWLKLLAKGKIPIRINPQSFWYRTSNTGELSRSKNNHDKAMALINKTAKTVKKDVEVIQYPRMSTDEVTNNIENLILPKYEVENSVLFIIKNTLATKENIAVYELIKRLRKMNYHVSLVSTNPSFCDMKQDLEEVANEFFDLSNFLDYKDYPLFVNYLINSRNTQNVFVIDESFGYALMPTIKENNNKVKIHTFIESANNIREDFANYIDFAYTSLEDLLEKMKSVFTKVNFVSKGEVKNKNSKKQDRAKLKEKYEIAKEKIVISFIDNFSYETRPQVFLKIVEKLASNDKLYFIMSGEGQMEKDVKEKIEANNLEKKVLLLEEQDDYKELIELSDLIVKCASKEGNTFIDYQALSLKTPVISVDVGNEKDYLYEKAAEIVTYMDSKNEEEYSIYADKFIEKINKVLDNLTTYQEKASEFATTNEAYYDNYLEKIIASINEEVKPKDKVFKANIIYSYYTIQLKENFRNTYMTYYKDMHGIKPREEIDYSKFAIMKRRLRGYGIKNNIENEMHFIFLKLGFFAKTIKGLVMFIKNLVISVIYLLPIIFMFIVCLMKIVKRKVALLIKKVN